MINELYKVTALITRGRELLVFRHPTAGIQLPAGTGEAGESPEETVMREVFEETGLDKTQVKLVKHLVTFRQPLAPGVAVMQMAMALPEGELGRGHYVHVEQRCDGLVRIHYEEPKMQQGVGIVTEIIDTWLPENAVSNVLPRHLFHLTTTVPTPDLWKIPSDRGFDFTLFWVNLKHDPGLIPPQDDWLRRARPYWP